MIAKHIPRPATGHRNKKTKELAMKLRLACSGVRARPEANVTARSGTAETSTGTSPPSQPAANQTIATHTTHRSWSSRTQTMKAPLVRTTASSRSLLAIQTAVQDQQRPIQDLGAVG